jgi:hypothetical protein
VSAHVLAADVVALLFVAIGFHMAFRQRLVRRWWRAARGAAADAQRREPRPQEEDPAHYALLIFGMMLLAFGLIIAGFTTVYAFLT